ncbi:MAG TPA: DedA family protein [Bryobacteraceae bacterium]|nr:DedA family protein [Bryobacteraceae bacterium]
MSLYLEAMSHVFEWISQYGYGAIFLLLMLGVVGLPIPDETLLVYCGYLISKGVMHPVAAFLTAVAGSWCGISLSYAIGRTAGLGVVHKYGKYIHLTQERLDKVHEWFDRIGHWALFVGYYIAGVRHITAIIAGTSRLKYTHFIAYAWAGGALWVGTFLTLGYFLGENWRRIAEMIHHYLLYVSIGVLALTGLYLLIRQRRAG